MCTGMCQKRSYSFIFLQDKFLRHASREEYKRRRKELLREKEGGTKRAKEGKRESVREKVGGKGREKWR